jgi:hypothetical protein
MGVRSIPVSKILIGEVHYDLAARTVAIPILRDLRRYNVLIKNVSKVVIDNPLNRQEISPGSLSIDKNIQGDKFIIAHEDFDPYCEGPHNEKIVTILIYFEEEDIETTADIK